MIAYAFFHENNRFEPVNSSFWASQFITWNFAKMIAYAVFHEKNRFEPVKIIVVSFQNFTLA